MPGSTPDTSFAPITLPPNFMNAGTTGASYQNIMNILGTKLPNTSDYLPQIQNLLTSSLSPGVQAAKDVTGSQIADAAGFFGKRGLTGSSIEATGMGDIAGRGAQGIDQMIGANQQSFASLAMAALNGDVNAMRQLQTSLAQATGQELGSQRDMSMFNSQLQAGTAQADANRQAQLQQAIMGMFSNVGGAAAGAGMFSDERLKKNVKFLGAKNGLPWYEYQFKHKEHPDLKLPKGKRRGYMAHEVALRHPQAVGKRNGYLTVDYSKVKADA